MAVNEGSQIRAYSNCMKKNKIEKEFIINMYVIMVIEM